jgi:hypothetical protein
VIGTSFGAALATAVALAALAIEELDFFKSLPAPGVPLGVAFLASAGFATGFESVLVARSDRGELDLGGAEAAATLALGFETGAIVDSAGAGSLTRMAFSSFCWSALDHHL